MGMEKRGVCGMCHNKCDIVATLEHGRLVKVEADSKSPRGRVCPRGKKSPEIVYSEKRILHPLVCGNDVCVQMKGGECVEHWPKGLYALSFCLEEISNWAGSC